jgi:hypothetical protein
MYLPGDLSPHLFIYASLSDPLSECQPLSESGFLFLTLRSFFLLFSKFNSGLKGDGLLLCVTLDWSPESEFVNLERSPGINSLPGGWNRFLGFLNVCKFGLRAPVRCDAEKKTVNY